MICMYTLTCSVTAALSNVIMNIIAEGLEDQQFIVMLTFMYVVQSNILRDLQILE